MRYDGAKTDDHPEYAGMHTIARLILLGTVFVIGALGVGAAEMPADGGDGSSSSRAANGPALVEAPEPVCAGVADQKACWIPVQGMPDCHVWNPNPQPEETVSFDSSASCANGKLTGTGVLAWRFRKDGEWTSISEPGGPYVNGKRHGSWTVRFENGSVYEGPYVEGNRHGRWVETAADGGRQEGHYVAGAPDGRWVYYDSADNVVGGGLWANGLRQGHWVTTDVYGDVRSGKFVDGKRDGEWRTTNAKSGLSVVRVYAAGELSDLRVVNPDAAPRSMSDSGQATVPGAFGIAFGTDVTQLKNMTCPSASDSGRNCFTALNSGLVGTLSFVNGSENGLAALKGEHGAARFVYLNPTDPPRPVAGGREYGVSFEIWDGRIAQVDTEFHFPSEAECEEEEARIVDLLERKYGRCRDPRFPDILVGHTPIGQCDANGLVERTIGTYCTDDLDGIGFKLRLYYESLNDAERNAVRDAWMRTGRPDADSL